MKTFGLPRASITPLKSILEGAGAPLDRPTAIEAPAPAAPSPEDARASALAEAAKIQRAWDAFDIRLAMTLNAFLTTMTQGGHRDFTNIHAREIRRAMRILDGVMDGDPNAIVPSGFGEPTRLPSTDIDAMIAEIKNLHAKSEEVSKKTEAQSDGTDY